MTELEKNILEYIEQLKINKKRRIEAIEELSDDVLLSKINSEVIMSIDNVIITLQEAIIQTKGSCGDD